VRGRFGKYRQHPFGFGRGRRRHELRHGVQEARDDHRALVLGVAGGEAGLDRLHHGGDLLRVVQHPEQQLDHRVVEREHAPLETPGDDRVPGRLVAADP
jgi:hypothetical protein